MGPTQRPGLYRLGDSLANIGCGIMDQSTGLFSKVIGGRSLYRRISLTSAWRPWEMSAQLAFGWRLLCCRRGVLLGPPPQPWRQHPVDRPCRTPPERGLQPRGGTAAKRPAKSAADVGVLAPGCAWVPPRNLPDLHGGQPPVSILDPHRTDRPLGPLEWVMNTPSHHRVHHGRNPEYIDRNHAGVFIVWDRMFGTFQQELVKPTYGITRPTDTFNPVHAQWKPVVRLVERPEAHPGWWDRISVFVCRPRLVSRKHRRPPRSTCHQRQEQKFDPHPAGLLPCC